MYNPIDYPKNAGYTIAGLLAISAFGSIGGAIIHLLKKRTLFG